MPLNSRYDAVIIGGGLAGLAASLELASSGHEVLLVEKSRYPLHKVCGEYISMESWNFLERQGLPLEDIKPPIIRKLQLTAPNGKEFQTDLPLGGFGLSRFRLDDALAHAARQKGVHIFEETKASAVKFVDDHFDVQLETSGSKTTVSAPVCLGAQGKKSNLDLYWQRSFLEKTDRRLNNYIAVKYHLRIDRPADRISLHNFENGYCGISQIEDGKHCLCYMTRAENLKAAGGDLKTMERTLLSRNPHLKAIFEEGQFLPGFPVTISQIHFSNKEQVLDHVLMIGDAAGMITPLCGNGMSIALHTGKLAAEQVSLFLTKKIDRPDMEREYKIQWQKQFARRLATGRTLQSFFGSVNLSNVLVGSLNTLPFLSSPLIRMTHGKQF